MIKFGSLNVKDIRIGEQQVKKVAVGSEIVWEKSGERLIYGWDNSMGLPDSNLWDYPIGSGTATMVYGYLRLQDNLNGYAGLRLKDEVVRNGDNRKLIVKFNPKTTSLNGTRIIVSDDPINFIGLQITINGGYLNVLSRGDGLASLTRTAPITYNAWHTIELIYRKTGISQIYLDGVLVAEQTYAQLSNAYAGNTWILAQAGICDIESFKVYDI